jgi:chondroitin sulfate proteoglycan 4
LWSPNGLIFNDLNWHDVVISRYESNFTMQIDEHFVRNNLPLNVAELNVHFGVFLGGVGEFTEAYLGALENFRGCISDVRW